MDQTNLYVPDYQKWKNYYDKIIENDTRTDMSMVNELFGNNNSSSSGVSNVSLNLVSPVKMLTEQAKNDIKRNDVDGQNDKSSSKEKLVQNSTNRGRR